MNHPETLKVLIAEDDAMYTKLLQKFLKDENVEFAVTTDGCEAYERAKEFKPDLVISDWMMPEMTGEELCLAIKQNPELKRTYFILLTAKDDIEDIVLGFEKGSDDYIIKPCNIKELLARVRTGLRILRLQRENDRLQAIKLVNQMAITSNHEINNPLQAIEMYAETILFKHKDLPENVLGSLRKILDNVSRIRTVTQKLENMIQIRSEKYTTRGPEMISLDDSE
ncbi:MAG: response regulator [Candidatus Marinimicrobia bacterium]|nr:response regulator [Candidatus Neomarinimicrobiota bacterium]MCF7841120.1 response regulator [Candidatus Neomarinimicrobiota bacterium]MCF7901790.1 response regulator [Candidatus Neomarinimicrobiota bacterium]